MDEVLNDWKRFSLLEEENSKVTLDEENPATKEVILAGKFMTRRALSVEAVGRTLKPLWKTRNGFEIREVGNHVLLFVFDDENEAERILATEPWTYDKHLIILSHYDGSCPIQSVRFHTVNFWIQIHGLPVNRLNEKTAYGIGKSIGEVSRASRTGELICGNFLRVRGRKVMIGDDREVWVNLSMRRCQTFATGAGWCRMMQRSVVGGYPARVRCLWINKNMVHGSGLTRFQWKEVLCVCTRCKG